MADINKPNNILSVIATSSSRVRELPIKNSQLIFIQDMCRIAFDFNGKRVFYNQITELSTEAERIALDSPLSGYYFVIDQAVLWRYQNGWVQLTEKPKEVIFIGVELPELGQENKIYVDKKEQNISVWDEETSEYIVVGEKTRTITTTEIHSLFN